MREVYRGKKGGKTKVQSLMGALLRLWEIFNGILDRERITYRVVSSDKNLAVS